VSFGSCLGRRAVVATMLSHSQAQKRLGPNARRLTDRYGHWMVRLFGYPLAVGIRQRARAVLEALAPRPGERILDVGCGIGYYVFELATRFRCHAYGIDLDAEDVRLAGMVKRRLEADTACFGVADGAELPFAQDTFDKMLCSEVIEHIRDDVAFLAGLRRVLRPGGRLVLTTPWASQMQEFAAVDMTIRYAGAVQSASNVERERPDHHGHVRNGYTVEGMEERLAAAGFRLTSHRLILKQYSSWGIRLGMAGFPIGYPLSMLDAFSSRAGSCLVVVAEKVGPGPGRGRSDHFPAARARSGHGSRT